MGRYLDKIRRLEQANTLPGVSPVTGPEHGLSNTSALYEINETNEISPMAPGVHQRLSKALGDKQHELALRRSDLTSPDYQDDPWVLEQIALLEGHIAEITRYLKEGGELALPRCCNQTSLICLAAGTGFNVCILSPVVCGYEHAAQGSH